MIYPLKMVVFHSFLYVYQRVWVGSRSQDRSVPKTKSSLCCWYSPFFAVKQACPILAGLILVRLLKFTHIYIYIQYIYIFHHYLVSRCFWYTLQVPNSFVVDFVDPVRCFVDFQDNFHEPQRIVICALIERAAVRVGGPAKVDVKFKAQLQDTPLVNIQKTMENHNF